MTVTAIERLADHVETIKTGNHETVKPGMPCRITEAWVKGDAVAQGDLNIVVADKVPAGYVRVDKPKAIDKQLVPGNTQGSKHCLDSLVGVKLYRPENWGPESLDGPCLVLSKERTILHPTHGHVSIPAGFIVACSYQRELDNELKKERRARD